MITAILLNWKREKELEDIKRYLENFKDVIDEIIVWDNRKINLINYGRYLGALEAKNNTIYVQDDDCIVKNLRQLVESYDKTCIVSNMKEGHFTYYQKEKDTLVGWGALFEKQWIPILNKYIKEYGFDYLFFREADRIFTGLFGKFKNIVADVDDFPSARDPEIALFKQENHYTMGDEARKRVRGLLGD